MNEIKETFSQKINKSSQVFHQHSKQVEIHHIQRENEINENAFKKFEKFV
jgi:hypothetical protein